MFTISDYRKAVRNGAFAWPGGYPLYFVMADGEACCFKSIAKTNRRLVLEALAYGNDKQWQPVAFVINWEDDNLYCADTNEPIEVAYSQEPLLPLDGEGNGP